MYVGGKIDKVRESFLRINTQGMKITTADAIFTRAEGLDLRDFYHEVSANLDSSFSGIPEQPVLFSLAAIHGVTDPRGKSLSAALSRVKSSVDADPSLKKLLTKDWNRLTKSFGKAVDFLRQNYSVLARDFLYSDYLVSVLAAFYYWNGVGPTVSQKIEIDKWYWDTSVGSRYSGSDFYRCLPVDLRFFKSLSENEEAKFRYVAQVAVADVGRSHYAARTGITSAFYSLLLKKGPISILDDGLNPIPLDRYSTNANRRDRHHNFPRAVLSNARFSAKLYNSICNICLLTAEENQRLGSRRPSSYLGAVCKLGYFGRKMDRHLIPIAVDGGIWMSSVRKGYDKFRRERTALIVSAFEREAGIKLFRSER